MSIGVTQPSIDAFATRLIRRKALELVRKAGLTATDRDDVAQELTLRLLQRLERFDPQRAHLNAYVTTVVERQAKNLLRDCYARKRDQRRSGVLSIQVPDGAGETCALEATLTEDDCAKHRGRVTTSDSEQFELAHDLAVVMAKLPANLLDICERLQHYPPAEVARQLGVTRYAMDEALRELRQHFEAAGLDACS